MGVDLLTIVVEDGPFILVHDVPVLYYLLLEKVHASCVRHCEGSYVEDEWRHVRGFVIFHIFFFIIYNVLSIID